MNEKKLMGGEREGGMSGWMDGWTDGRMDGWIDGWMRSEKETQEKIKVLRPRQFLKMTTSVTETKY